MKSQQALKQQETSSPIFVEAEKLFEQVKDFSHSVAKRAYEFFEQRGRELGHDVEDWFRAEFELMRAIPVKVTQTDVQVTVRAEVPGFKANEIKISVEPNQLILSGKSEQKKEAEKAEQVFSEFCSQQFYRKLPLPAKVDPEKATAKLNDGVLELTLAKAALSAPVNVEVMTA